MNNRAEKEIQLRINVPNFQHADLVINLGLNLMFKNAKDPRDRLGHFVGWSEDVSSSMVSRSVDSRIKKAYIKAIYDSMAVTLIFSTYDIAFSNPTFFFLL